MVTKTKDNSDWILVADSVKPDSKRRIVLPKNLVRKGITYRVFLDSRGQIILEPQVTIPESELWLFENKEALASVDRGMAETTRINRGSFAKYVKNAP